MFIVDPTLADEDRETIVERVKAWIEERVGGKVDSVDRMGKRKLAFKVKRFTEGDYTVMIFRARPESVNELERFYHFTPEIFRWQTFRRLDLEKKEAKAMKAASSTVSSTSEESTEKAEE
ncbi:MAG: 30S ribosomal protein S6 [Thermotogae bacterium]|nr:30S ribosomal protein S6 [Thermotogota bacterium]RKX45594.1 MAG: 30S ribosomal protein S6 [Thermotogota bacterium]